MIGVASNKNIIQKPKINNDAKQLHRKQPLLAGGCFSLSGRPTPSHKNTRPSWSGIFVGGAAGYCPRVRQVTYRSSTYIVLLGLFSHVIR